MRPDLLDRWLDKIDVDHSGCWLWIAAKVNGYGVLNTGDGLRKAHRLSYEHFVGPIPDGLCLDHLCVVRRCVNPDHLEPVTLAENVRRANEARGVGQYATHCLRGHEFTSENTYLAAPQHGKPSCRRQCRACVRDGLAARRSAAAAKATEVAS